MPSKNQNTKIIWMVISLILASLACGSLQVGVVTPTEVRGSEPTQVVQPTETEVAVPIEEGNQPTDVTDPASTEDVPQAQNGAEVIAWLGHITSLPEGSQYDDMVLLSPPGTGEFGLTGATPEIEAEIRSLRDVQGPHEFVHLWGTLNCDVDDFNNCQLVVDKLQYGAKFSEENLNVWRGTIKSHTFNGGDTSVFELAGDYPMWYSIHSSQNPEMQSKIESLRNTGTLVEVSGKLMVGVPDVNGTRIEPGYLEVIEVAVVDPAETNLSPEAMADWSVFINDVYGYQIQHPPEAIISFFGPAGFATNEKPANMTDEEYMNSLIEEFTDRLCIRIEYSLGWISIAAPPNKERTLTPCGPTGVGAGDLITKVENIEVGGQPYEANGHEIMLKLDDGAGGTTMGETLDMHHEMFYIELEDGTVIRFGSSPNHEATYADYLAQTKAILRQIIATYEKLP